MRLANSATPPDDGPRHTMSSCHRIVLAQLEGSGRGSLASYNSRSYEDLVGLIEEHPMTDGDAWLKLLLAKNEMLGAVPPPDQCVAMAWWGGLVLYG